MNTTENENERFMRAALQEAEAAFEEGEIPVGAVIVRDGGIVARAHNRTETSGDPTAHAEMSAIREASEKLGGWRLFGCSMYVTLEPCAMCAGALVWSRIDRLWIGTMDPKAGACGSLFDIVRDPRLNHSLTVETGVLREECSDILKRFFSDLRSGRIETARTRRKHKRSQEDL